MPKREVKLRQCFWLEQKAKNLMRKIIVNYLVRVVFCLLLIFWGTVSYSQSELKHFVFFSSDREGIHNSAFYNNAGVCGAQITYAWKTLEPAKDQYNFTRIEADLKFLKAHHKKLFIQLQDVTFDSTLYVTPKYILADTAYHGGADAQYDLTNENKPIKAGWVTRRWDPAVAERFYQLLRKLAVKFDGRIEGINLPETSVEFILKDGLVPKGFTRAGYVNVVEERMRVLKSCFVKSVALQYANFMPGYSKESLEEIYRYAREIKIAMGGPDIMVYKSFQMDNSYPLIRNMYGFAPTGMAVQDGDYGMINPKTGKKATIAEIVDFATNYLRLTYLFWCTEEPYYSKQVLPMLNSVNFKK